MRLQRLRTVVAVMAVTGLIVACGGGESPTDDRASPAGEAPEEQGGQAAAPTMATLESTLRTTIEDVRDSPERPLEAVDCPDDVELGGEPVKFECELSGGSETGSVEVTVRGGKFEYTGTFGGSSFGGSPQPLR